MHVLRTAAAAAALLVVAALTTGCSPTSGDTVASDAIRDGIAELDRAVTPVSSRSVDAETLAARILERSDDPAADRSTVVYIPLAWHGVNRTPEGATVDVRIESRFAGSRGGWLPDVRPGSALRCVRFTFEYTRLSTADIPCPAATTPPSIPVEAPPPPGLPADADERLRAALLSATPDSLDADVRAAFDGMPVTVDTGVKEGALQAAVGMSEARECVLGERRTDGTVSVDHPPSVYLLPGESGCSRSIIGKPAPH